MSSTSNSIDPSSENDPSSTSNSISSSLKSSKALLTQEFNTVPSTTTSGNTNDGSSSTFSTASLMSLSENGSAFTIGSLPFVLSPETLGSNSGASGGYNPTFPAFVYHPVPVYSPEQYLFMMQKHQQTTSTKRVKISTIESASSTHSSSYASFKQSTSASSTSYTHPSSSSNSAIIEQLNSFKNSLKGSFDRNLQKLEVLDRLVQTVTIKGSFQMDSLKGILGLLQTCKDLLKLLVNEQVEMTATICSEIRLFLLPEILSKIGQFSFVDNAKTELFDKLRKEEDSHLTDLTILSARNKELQKDSRNTKDQLDRLQLEYSDALKASAIEKEETEQFLHQLSKLLFKTEEFEDKNCLLDEIESLLSDKDEKQLLLSNLKEQIQVILFGSGDDKEQSSNTPIPVDINIIGETFTFIITKLSLQFENILHERERFYNNSLNNLTRKIEELIQFQSKLAHKSLIIRVGLQGQLSDSYEISARLRKHCQELTSELNLTCTEIDKKRLLLQVKDSELIESKRRIENSNEQVKNLEQELSVKNQENRTLGIRIQSLQNELEEAEEKHRHDLTALERKIYILESKLKKEKEACEKEKGEKEMKDIINIDPFSSLKDDDIMVGGRSDDLLGIKIKNDHSSRNLVDESISTIPPTIAIALKKKVIITFTGIRDSSKQKELTNQLSCLGATVHVGADFNDDITHVLAPRGYRSIRVLAASLTGKWIVPVDWVDACHGAGQFVSELFHGGYCNTNVRPFRLRTLWMSAAFTVTHKSHPIYPTGALRTLLEKLGKARWCQAASQADFLLVTEEEKESKLIASNRGGVLLTLNNLINMIPIE